MDNLSIIQLNTKHNNTGCETNGKRTVNTPSPVTSHSQIGEECSDSPDLQATELQRHPITDFTRMILHVIIAHLSDKRRHVDIIQILYKCLHKNYK